MCVSSAQNLKILPAGEILLSATKFKFILIRIGAGLIVS